MDPLSIIYAVAMLVVSYAITASMAKKTPTTPPAAFEDFQFPQFDEGTPQIVVFGDVWLDDWMVLWYGNYKVTSVQGKGGKK